MKYIVEYVANYSDGVTDYEQTINFSAENNEDAKFKGVDLVRYWWFGWKEKWKREQTTECSFLPPEVWEEDRRFNSINDAETYIEEWMKPTNLKVVKHYE